MEQSRITLDHIEQYINHLRKEERSEATIKKYRRDITDFYMFLPTDKIGTKDAAIAYKKYLQTNYENTSTNSMLAAINGFLQYLGLDACRVKRIKVQRQIYCEERRELTKEDYLKLVSVSNTDKDQRIHMILQTICGTGIRVSELEYFTVQAVKSGRVQVSCKDKTRTVFIPRILRSKLLNYIKKNGITSGCVFITRGGKPVNRSNIWKEMQRICKKAGVTASKVFPHNLRHLFARTYYKMKQDLCKLADILGHSNIETTRIYTITTGKEHEKQIECLGLVT